MRLLIGLGFVTAGFIVAYWAAVLAGAFPVEDLVPGYRAWFMAFPVADAWISVWAAAMSFAVLHRRLERARRFALLAGSALVFLGLYAMTYGVTTGLVCRPTLDEYAEIGIKLYCLVVGGGLAAWGLGPHGRRAATVPPSAAEAA